MYNRVDMIVLTGHHWAQVCLWKPTGIIPPALNPGSYGGWTCLDMETHHHDQKKQILLVFFSKIVLVLSHFIHVQLSNPLDHSPPSSSVHWILQARMLEWVCISSSREYAQPKD